MDEQEGKKVKYICEGTCGAQISQEEYNAGLQACGTEGCTHKGQPFKRVEVEDTEEVSSDAS